MTLRWWETQSEMDGWKNTLMDGWINCWMMGLLDGWWTNGFVVGWMDGLMDAWWNNEWWMDLRLDGWMWMNGWTDDWRVDGCWSIIKKKSASRAGRQRQGSRRISGSSVSTLCVVEPLRISCWKPNEMQTACLMVRVQPIYANNISSRAADEARRVNTMSAACIYWLIFAILWCLGTNCSQAVLKSGKHPPPLCSFWHTLHTRSPQGWCNAGLRWCCIVASRMAVEESMQPNRVWSFTSVSPPLQQHTSIAAAVDAYGTKHGARHIKKIENRLKKKPTIFYSSSWFYYFANNSVTHIDRGLCLTQSVSQPVCNTKTCILWFQIADIYDQRAAEMLAESVIMDGALDKIILDNNKNNMRL